MKDIGTRLWKIRESQNKIQYTVAVEAGISQSAYARIESGQRIPRLKTLESIAKSLNVPVSHLLPTTGSSLVHTTVMELLFQRFRDLYLRWRCTVAVRRAPK